VITTWLFPPTCRYSFGYLAAMAITDAAGNAVDVSGSQISFQAATGRDQLFTFTVSGPTAVPQ
jgi:hypothetical protein